jgi:hypothetical protein
MTTKRHKQKNVQFSGQPVPSSGQKLEIHQ